MHSANEKAVMNEVILRLTKSIGVTLEAQKDLKEINFCLKIIYHMLTSTMTTNKNRKQMSKAISIWSTHLIDRVKEGLKSGLNLDFYVNLLEKVFKFYE